MDNFKPITIVISDMNKPPKVLIGGELVEGAVELEYFYKTSTHRDRGEHRVKYNFYDKKETIGKTIGFERV